MSEKKYVVIPFESAEDAREFRDFIEAAGHVRNTTLNADEYPTKRHNGWTNYETWAVKLWMDNEEPSYRYWQAPPVRSSLDAPSWVNPRVLGQRPAASGSARPRP